MMAQKEKRKKCETQNKENNSSKRIKYDEESYLSVEHEYERPVWKDHKLLAEFENLNDRVASELVRLFDDGNTIPFIARYRRNLTGNLSVEKLRDAKETYEKILTLKAKEETIIKKLKISGNLNDSLQSSILAAKTVDELEYIYAPYKTGSKRTLAERAKALGLEEPALKILENSEDFSLSDYIDKNNKELSSIEEVEKGIMHILAHIIATDSKVLENVRKIRLDNHFIIQTKKSTAKVNSKINTKLQKNVEENKYELYYDFCSTSNNIKPHQVLAINRGETQKKISVKVIISDFIFSKFKNFCFDKFLNKGNNKFKKDKLVEAAIEDCYNRLIQPLLIREIRSDLKAKAEKASLEVFSSNLKQKLLANPVKGKVIMGIDPGYKNGCKIALISETGSVIDTKVIYPFSNKSKKSEEKFKRIIKENNCTLIALGNGTACRETEKWISDLICNNAFKPLEVFYTIVEENGTSIYSCSSEARKEFPSLDVNLISAVSIARRVQEPLAELVKVDPRHLGIGMYQHDLSKKKLEAALDEVITECVSFVGVDLNTASQFLLKKIAGFHEKRATAVINHREKNGPFLNRMQLKEVSGIGAKVFEQCAGFIRVGPINAELTDEFYYQNKNANKLDCTNIHPESYEICEKIIKKLNLQVIDIGKWSFISEMQKQRKLLNVMELSEELKTSKESIDLIIDCLSKPLNFDFRLEMDQTPLFKKSLTKITELRVASILTGRISNVTHFGCFVDIGVAVNGLIHSSKQKGSQLKIGDKVEVKILNIAIDRKRIGLELCKKI